MQNPQTSTPPIPQLSVKPKLKTKKFKLIIFFLMLVAVSVILFGIKKASSNINKVNIEGITNSNNAEAVPTQVPFAELTIPYLRTKKYESNLAELVQVSSGSNYTAYLTSYTSDRFKINGLLTRPIGKIPDGGFPAIVFVHGYIPPATYQTNGTAYADYVDFLARSGFVVFKIDLRGHGESEGEAGGGYYGSDYVTDTLSAYSALQKSGFVNADKIGLWGHSMAGNAVLRSMTVRPEIPAGVIWAGAVFSYTDMTRYGINDTSYQPPANNSQRQAKRRELFEKYGSPSASNNFWKQVAPTNYLSDIKGAISLYHAADDNVVNIGYSRDLNELLDKTSIKHELFEYNSGGHNITGSSFNQAMQKTVEFFKANL